MSQKPALLKGTRDFGPAEMARRNFIFSAIRSVFQKYGYLPLETPAIESLSVLMGKYGEEGDMLLFKILNSGDFLSETSEADYREGHKKMLLKVTKKGLRYDLTVPFARYVAMNRGTLTFPFRRYQIQPVWRADRPQKGRYSEFYQCDADVVGTESLICEAEIVAMIQDVFQLLSLEQYVIKINNRKFLAGLAAFAGEPGKEADLCVAIDKLDKIGVEKVEEELVQRGFQPDSVRQIMPLLALSGTAAEKLSSLRQTLHAHPEALQGLAEMEEVFSLLGQMGVPTDRLEFDPALARGLSYYTGAIFEVKALGVQMGSISGGGRYDNLTGVFGVEGIPGVGFSFGVDRIYDVMTELNLFPDTTFDTTQVMFANFDAEGQRYCLPLLQQFRAAGVRTEIFPEQAKLKKQLNYANQKGIRFVLLAGSEEMAQQKLTIKDMVSGEQELLSLTEVLPAIRARLA